MRDKEIRNLAVRITEKSMTRDELIRARSEICEEYDRRVAMGRRSAPEYTATELGYIQQLEAMRQAIN